MPVNPITNPDKFEAERNLQITNAVADDEATMRTQDAPTFDATDELETYINKLVDRPHSYGTCVYAMSLAATAAFNYVAHKLGATGFQASCADMDILRQTRNFSWGRIVNYDNLLYPQYCNEDHFPGYETLLEANSIKLAERARELLEKNGDHAAESVKAHWKKLAKG